MKQKTKIILLSVLVALSITIGISIDALMIAPKQLSVRYEIVEDAKIDSTLNGLSILFFSDLHYNGFVDETRLKSIVNKINEQKADIVIFLGDLYEQSDNVVPSSEAQTTLVSYLKKINAPYGKFAVYGDQDIKTSLLKDIVDANYLESGFEVISNRQHSISLKSMKTIDLFGIDSELYGSPDYETIFSEIDSRNYSIVLCHTPDTVLNVYSYGPDRMVSGHTLGGQIYLPVLGSVHRYDYGVHYFRGINKVDNTTLDVNSGVGTTWKDIRLFSKAEIEVYHFYSKQD